MKLGRAVLHISIVFDRLYNDNIRLRLQVVLFRSVIVLNI